MLYNCDDLCPGQLGSVCSLLGGPATSEVPSVEKSLYGTYGFLIRSCCCSSLMKAWTPVAGLCRQSCFLFGCGALGVEDGEPHEERRRHPE